MYNSRFFHSIETKWFWWVSGVLLLAFLLRIWEVNTESAWIDEAYSIALAQHPPAEIIQGTAADQHPPLYYLMLSIWIRLKTSVPFARWFSLIIGLLGVYQTIRLGQSIGGHVVGFISGLLIAISPMHTWYSQEVRMYILLASLTTATTHTLWNGLNQPSKKWWLWYCFFSLVSLYTHYFSLFAILSQGAWILVWTKNKKRTEALLKWGTSVLVASALFLPWLPIVVHQSKAHTLRWISTPTLLEIHDTILRLIYGSSIQVLPVWGRILLSVFVACSILKAFNTLTQPDRQGYLFITWMAIFPFLIITLISIVYPIFQFKQTIIILTPLLLWMAWSVKYLPRHWGLIFLGLIIALSTITTVHQSTTSNKDDWQSATRYIYTNSRPDDLIFGNPAAVSLAISLYTTGEMLPFSGYPPDYDILTGGWEGRIITEQVISDILIQATSNKQRLWLVEYYPTFWDPNHYVDQWLSKNGTLLDNKSFGHINIRLYSIKKIHDQ